MASQHPDIEKVLFTQEDIDGIVSRLGEQITRDYAGKDLVLIAVLRGAVVFMGDLMRKIELPTNIDFMAVSSYGDGVKSSGIVRIIKDLDIDIRGRDVLIVEDILDSGLTLKYLMKNRGIVLTRDSLMEKIWGYDFEHGNRTVDVHIQSLRKKLGTAGDAIKTIRNVGYKIGD